MTIKPARLVREDLPGDVPKWFQVVIDVLNPWMSAVTSELSKAPFKIKTIKFSTGANTYDSFPIDLENPLDRRPSFVILGGILDGPSETIFDAPTQINWQMNGDKIRIRHIYTISSNHDYTATLVIG